MYDVARTVAIRGVRVGLGFEEKLDELNVAARQRVVQRRAAAAVLPVVWIGAALDEQLSLAVEKRKAPHRWGRRRAAGAAGRFQDVQAALWGAQERPEPQEAPGGQMGRCSHTGQKTAFYANGGAMCTRAFWSDTESLSPVATWWRRGAHETSPIGPPEASCGGRRSRRGGAPGCVGKPRAFG